MQVEQMRAFIIKFIFFCIWAGLAYIALKFVLPFLMPFLLGFLIAYLLQPLVTLAVRARLPRGLAGPLILLTFYAVTAAVCTILGTQLTLLIRDIFVKLPDLYATVLQPALERMQDWIEGALQAFSPTLPDVVANFGDTLNNTLAGFVQTISEGALSWAGSLATQLPSAFVKVIITLVVSFFCVVDFPLMISFLKRGIPASWGTLLGRVKAKGVDVLLRFGRAYALLMGLTFLELLIGFSLLRVENAFLAALCIATVDILPVLGTGTILIPWGVAMLVLGNFPFGIGILILYAIITVVRQILEPRVIGKQIGLYPLMTLACMFIGTYLFGFLGLFGLPILATVALHLHREGAFQKNTSPEG